MPTTYNFAVIYPRNFEKAACFLTVSIAFSVYKQNIFSTAYEKCEYGYLGNWHIKSTIYKGLLCRK